MKVAPITDAIAALLASIPELAAAMAVTDAGGNVNVRISAFHYRLGAEHRLAEAIYKMPAPSILVVWDGTQGGNFNGYQIWKHRFHIHIRMGNMAGNLEPVGYEELWDMICYGIPDGASTNIRYINILPGLDIMDTPTTAHALDEDLVDRFVGIFVIPQIGDN
jgi:hypothetical protein